MLFLFNVPRKLILLAGGKGRVGEGQGGTGTKSGDWSGEEGVTGRSGS